MLQLLHTTLAKTVSKTLINLAQSRRHDSRSRLVCCFGFVAVCVALVTRTNSSGLIRVSGSLPPVSPVEVDGITSLDLLDVLELLETLRLSMFSSSIIQSLQNKLRNSPKCSGNNRFGPVLPPSGHHFLRYLGFSCF